MDCPTCGYRLQDCYDEFGIPFLHCAVCNAEYEAEFDGRLVARPPAPL